MKRNDKNTEMVVLSASAYDKKPSCRRVITQGVVSYENFVELFLRR